MSSDHEKRSGENLELYFGGSFDVRRANFLKAVDVVRVFLGAQVEITAIREVPAIQAPRPANEPG